VVEAEPYVVVGATGDNETQIVAEEVEYLNGSPDRPNCQFIRLEGGEQMMNRRKAQKALLTVLPLLLIGGLIVLGIPGCRPRVIIVIATLTPRGMTPQGPSEAAPGEVRITFIADRTSLNPGECATLQWNVEGGFEVLLGRMGEPGNKVGRSGQKQVCPKETTTYWLGVDTGEKVEHRQIQIVVAGAAPSQPPPTQPPAPQPPAPSVVINFRADDTSITAGQ